MRTETPYGMPELPADWQWKKLEDVCERVSVGHVGETSTYFCGYDGIPFLRSQNVRPGRLDLDEVKYITKDFHDKTKKSQLKAGDILIVRVGHNRGDCAVVPDGLGEINCANVVFARPDRSYSDFLGYFFTSSIGRAVLLAVSTGSAQGVLNTKTIAKIDVPIAPPDVAKKIGQYLRIIDDKIELNRKMNQTLESMARAIFRSWFVDFDPVRAKAEGRDTGLTPDIAALFPDSFEDSELGEIPKGWRVGRLDELLVLQRGFDLPTAKRIEGIFPVYAAGGFHGMHSEFMVKGPGIVTGRSGVLGNVFFVHEDFWPLNTTLWVKEFNAAGPAYAYYTINNLDFELFNAGSAVPTLNRNHVHNLPVIIPEKQVIEHYERIALPMFNAQNQNRIQSNTLASIRDALLPKLLSGEIRVKDAE